MLLGLRIDPVSDHLLLAAHVVHQPLNRFREIGHGGRGGPARSALGDCLPQSLDGDAQIALDRARCGRGCVPADAEIAHGGGEPILEFNIEAVLRLAGLQVEKAEHERARKSKQEAENAMPMPPSGAASPSLSDSNMAPASPPGLRLLITLPIEPMVSIKPQNVPSRPRNTSRAVM